MYTTRDDSLNKAHIRYLEAKLISLAQGARVCSVDNNTVPIAKGLCGAERDQMEAFLDEMLVLLPLLGVSGFASVQYEAPSATSAPVELAPVTLVPPPAMQVPATPAGERRRFYFREKGRGVGAVPAAAEGIDDPRGFIVLAGALGPARDGAMSLGYKLFLTSRTGKTVFGGMHAVGDFVPASPDDADPITADINPGDRVIWDLTRDVAWEGFEDRLVIDWGKAFISWRQWAGRSPKPVVEITDQHETPSPGWRDFRCNADDLATLPSNWRGALAATRGVYLLLDLDAGGRPYIGSAKGSENLLGRLLGYADGGTNGNRGLTPGHRYQVSILEVVGTGESDLTIERIESQWKDKLGTRSFGLNQN